MAPAPEGWEGPGPSPEGFFPVYRGSERAFLAKRLVPGVQYCGRVKAINCEVGGREGWLAGMAADGQVCAAVDDTVAAVHLNFQ